MSDGSEWVNVTEGGNGLANEPLTKRVSGGYRGCVSEQNVFECVNEFVSEGVQMADKTVK